MPTLSLFTSRVAQRVPGVGQRGKNKERNMIQGFFTPSRFGSTAGLLVVSYHQAPPEAEWENEEEGEQFY